MSPDETEHLSAEALEAGLETILRSPKDAGPVMMVVRRPAVDQREMLETAELDRDRGLVGDNWLERGAAGFADPEMQLNIMNSRVIALVAGSKDRWALAGDQVFVDIDLGRENLPAGTRLGLGDAVIEVTPAPHAGCRKFAARFGVEAMKFVNSGLGKKLCLRGINARIVEPGTFAVGDTLRKLDTA